MFIFELDIIQTLIIEEMSLFFNKNRQPGRNSQPRWQKKQTAINSHNDKFTIYAQMQPKLQQSSNNWFLQHNQNRMSSSQTPITRSKISKMKQTLTNLQLVNDAYRQSKQVQLDFDNSNASSINNSRKRQQQIKQDYIQQQRNQVDNMTRNKQPENINKINNSFYRNPNIGSLRTEQQQTNYEQQSNYNEKLQLMKKRLQLIYQKQFKQQQQKDNNSGQNLLFSIQSPQSSIYFKNQASKNSSQQSTTRQKDKPKGLNGQIYTSKNTVPMPTIIHEDQIQELQIPSTIHLNSHVHNHHLAHIHDSKKVYQNTTNRPINKKITKGMKSISYNNTLSQKKQQDGSQFYYELYPSMSQELDMKIYKNFEEDGKNQRYNEDIKNQRHQLYEMRKELQNAQKSIWLHGNIAIQAGRHNQSSQSTKRKTSNYSASAQLRIPNQTKGTTPIRSRSPIQKNNLITKGNTISAMQTDINKLRSQKTQIQIVKAHRASIKQILFEDMQDSLQMYTASKDYSVKLYEFDNQRSIINNYELYRHRGGITSLTKIDNILLSTGCDLYLKYYKVTAGRYPPDLQNMGMYKFDACPTQLLGINQNNIMVAASKDMWLFDIHACAITRTIQKQDSTLLQNGRNIYVATNNSLSIMDLRCADPIIKLSSDFPYISDWIVHPTQPIFIINNENKLLQVDMRYIKQPKKLLNPVMVLNNSQTIVNYCWSKETIAGRTSDRIQKLNTLTLLTQQIDLQRLRFKDNSAHVQKQVGIHKGTIANSMNIIREYEGTYYGGDKMGNLFKILLDNKQKYQQTLGRSRNYTQYQRKYEKIHAF